MKNIFIVLLAFYAFACIGELNKSAEQLQNDGQQYRTQKNLKESITIFKSIISKYPDHELAAQAQFQIADIYLNDVKDFEFAIEEFQKVVSIYPDHEVAKKSLFMIAYVYNNYLDAYSDAINYYNLFKEQYPNDELIPSVEYELDGLKVFQSTIDSLNSIVTKKSNI